MTQSFGKSFQSPVGEEEGDGTQREREEAEQLSEGL